MKTKKIFFTTLLAGILLFTSCGQKLEEPTSKNNETMIGEIQSLGGIKVNKTISHLFENEDNEIFYAYSERYDLSESQYFGLPIEAYGVIYTYDNIDKKVFEIRRISEASMEEDTSEEVKSLEFKANSLGFTLKYPSNWEKTELADSVQFTSLNTSSSSTGAVTGEFEPDYIIIAKTEAVLSKTSVDTSDDRASEIRDFVRSNYDNLVGTENDISQIGPDGVFALKYRSAGNISYFAVRNSELFELSFFHPGDDDSTINGIVFSEMISSFRFIPTSDAGNEIIEDEEIIDEEGDQEEPTVEEDTSEQVTVSKYREFESSPFSFKISYPSSWYYSGGSSGYDFSTEPIEEDTEVAIRLDLASSGTEGSSNSEGKFTITVKVDTRYYTLSGANKYETIMHEMAASIESIESDQDL